MPQKIKILKIIWWLILGLSFTTVFAVYFWFSGIIGSSHIIGMFTADNTGNAGTVSFDESWYAAGIEWFNISGSFYIQTVGPVTFNPGTRILPPQSGNIIDPWFVSWSVSSVNAGTIFLWDGTVGNTTTYYDPKTKTLVGYGYNVWLGKVPFWVLSTTTITGTGITSIGVSQGFEWRVKILGNIGGTSSFDTFYGLWVKFNVASFAQILNQMRQNVALLTRNLSNTQMNPSFWTTVPVAIKDHIFFINQSATDKSVKYSDIKLDYTNSTLSSVIIVGGDMLIDEDILNSTSNAKWVILLKNAAGIGGNVFIKDSVKNIQSSIFSEGTIYSGTDKLNLYNDSGEEVTILPPNQLYVLGSLISQNTIGWATQSGAATCPFTESNCSYQNAVKYDFNYFRAYVATGGIDPSRAYPSSLYDNYSLIIQKDPRTAPSWF